MKRSILIGVLLLCAGMAGVAQPNLRSSTLPAPFSSFGMFPCDTTGVRIGASGNGLIWNYASLIRRGTDSVTTTYTDKSGLPPAVRMRFPNAEVVVVDDTTTYIYRTVNNSWRMDGWVTPNTELVAGADPYDVRPVEIVFSNPSSDIFNGVLQSSFPIPGPKNITGSHSYVYDGFGQLTLPDHTYNNVARTSQRDTITAEVTIGVQKAFIKSFSRKTVWQEITSNRPLFVIDESTVQVVNANNMTLFGPFTYKTVRYRRYSETTDVSEERDRSILVAPCPSTGDQITLIGLKADPSSVVIINSIGEKMECPVALSPDGIRIDVHELTKGSYTVIVMEGPYMRTAGFVR